MSICDCAVETDGKWADKRSPDCASIRGTIEIGEKAKVRALSDGRWVILYTEDGGGGVATLSLTTSQALNLAELLKGAAITAAFAP